MPNRSGIEGVTQPYVTGGIGKIALLLAGSHTPCDPAGQRVIEVVLGAQGAKSVFSIGISPALGNTFSCIRSRGNGYSSAYVDIGLGSIHFMVLITQVC